MDGPPGETLTQVERLRELGLRAPQVSELAECLRRSSKLQLDFVRLEAAEDALTSHLRRGS